MANQTTSIAPISNDPSSPSSPTSTASRGVGIATATRLSSEHFNDTATSNATAADKKRSVLIGDISYSYAATDIGTAHGAHIKTLTVIKNVAIPTKHHRGNADGKPSGADDKKPSSTDESDWDKHVKHHFNLVVRVPEYPEIPVLNIGAPKPPSTHRNTKTPAVVKAEKPAEPAVAVAPVAAEKPAVASPPVKEVQVKQTTDAMPPAVAEAAAAIAPVKSATDGADETAAAAAAMEREIAQSMDEMHRHAQSYNTQHHRHRHYHNQHDAAAEQLPEAMSLVHHRPDADVGHADNHDDGGGGGADILSDDANNNAAPPPVVRDTFDNIPDDVEFVQLHAEPIITTRLRNKQQQRQHHRQHHPKHQPKHFVEDFSDYGMQNVQHLGDKPSPPLLLNPESHQTQQTAANALATHSDAAGVGDDAAPAGADADAYSPYRTISARDEAELNAAAAVNPIDYPTERNSGASSSSSDPEAVVIERSSSAGSAAYKIQPPKKVRPYTAPSLQLPYRTTSTTTQRVPYQAPIKSQKPAQFYIIHETVTSTQRPYLSPSVYKGYTLLADGEQRALEEQRLGVERDREERAQLEQERVQLEQQQHDQLVLQQKQQQQQRQQLRDQHDEQRQLRALRDRQRASSFLHQFDDEEPISGEGAVGGGSGIESPAAVPRAEFLRRPTAVPASSSSSPSSLSRDRVHLPTVGPPIRESQSDDQQQNIIIAGGNVDGNVANVKDDVEVFAPSIEPQHLANHASSPSESYQYERRRQRPAAIKTTTTTNCARHAGGGVNTRSRPAIPTAPQILKKIHHPHSSASSSSSSAAEPAAPNTFVAVPLDVSTAAPFQRDQRIGTQHRLPAHLARHQFVFDSRPPHAFLESPFRPTRRQTKKKRTATAETAQHQRR